MEKLILTALKFGASVQVEQNETSIKIVCNAPESKWWKVNYDKIIWFSYYTDDHALIIKDEMNDFISTIEMGLVSN